MQRVVDASEIVALLGPTNTGKTYRAIERMLEHDSGMIGLPLRLLAREVYDKLTTRVGEALVALITGEEKRVPRNPRYWVCTVEAMPQDREVDFLAVDEIQLAAHPERGHVFTDRLLHARGKRETWFLGAETIAKIVAVLLPTAQIRRSPRLSTLRDAGVATLGSLPRRSAVVGFSATRVYELAERLRARRGGAAVVLGALSPRARNAQVALYQSGEVDYMVATDAIGMGLNLDIDHVAFADLRKFDGREGRSLELAELAQIAGRAGRHTKNGTFGTLSPQRPFGPETVRRLETHSFDAIRNLVWRNADLDTSSVAALLGSLEVQPKLRIFRRVSGAQDEAALHLFVASQVYRDKLTSPDRVALAWSLCQIPDFRQILLEDHVALLRTLFDQLVESPFHVGDAFVDQRLREIAEPSADMHTLMAKIASIRTWNYIANQSTWLHDPESVRTRASAIEDDLSDALHQALCARFVEGRRARRKVEKAPPGAGSFAALLEKLGAGAPEVPASDWVADLCEAPHEAFVLAPDGKITFEGRVAGRLAPGKSLATPEVVASADLEQSERLRVSRRLVAFARDLAGQMVLGDAPRNGLSPAVRGILYAVERELGNARRADVNEQVALLSDEERRWLERHKLRVGLTGVFSVAAVKPAVVALRVVLARVHFGIASGVSMPRGVEVSVVADPRVGEQAYAAVGYRVVARRAVRVDVLERVAARIAATPPEERDALPIASWLGTSPRLAREASAQLVEASAGLTPDPG